MDEQQPTQQPAPTQVQPEQQVFTPTSTVAPESPVEVNQIHAQSGGTNFQESRLDNPLARILAWFFSGFVVLFAAVLFNLFGSLVFGSNAAINILTYLVGFAGVVLLFVGPYKAVKLFLQNK